jgi:hypothetical protein
MKVHSDFVNENSCLQVGFCKTGVLVGFPGYPRVLENFDISFYIFGALKYTRK